MQKLNCVVAGLVVTLALAGCAAGPMTGKEAFDHVLMHDVGMACVQQGMVRDLAASERFITEEASIIRNRISAAEQASARARIRQMRPSFPAVTPTDCRLSDMQAARYAREAGEQEQQRQSFDASMAQMQQQTAAMNANRPRQTICTNVGGGMAACNSY